MNQIEQRQRGGVVSFVIVGAVLLGLLVGGVYLSKQQGRTASRGGVATNTPLPQKAVDPEKKSDNTPVKQPADDKPSATTNRSNDTTRETTPPPSSQTPRSTSPPAVANTGPSQIATTGTGDVFVAAIALGAVVGGVSFYRQSNMRMHRAALRSSL